MSFIDVKCSGLSPFGAAESGGTQSACSVTLTPSLPEVEMVNLHLRYRGITCARVPTPLWKSSSQAQLITAGRFRGRLKSVQ